MKGGTPEQGWVNFVIKRATILIITIRGPLDRTLQRIGYERSYKIITNMNKICVYTCLFQWRLVIKFVCGVQSWMDKRYGLLDQVFCIKTIFFIICGPHWVRVRAASDSSLVYSMFMQIAIKTIDTKLWNIKQSTVLQWCKQYGRLDFLYLHHKPA